MTTLCRSDWIEANADHELQQAKINLLKLPTSSFEKMATNSPVVFANSRLSPPASCASSTLSWSPPHQE